VAKEVTAPYSFYLLGGLMLFRLAFIAMLAIPVVGFGSDLPRTSVDEDGSVVGQMVIEATQEEIRHILSQIDNLRELSTEVTIVESHRKGRCQEVERTSRGVWRPFRWLALRCPTAQGFSESLVQSTDLSHYETEWVLEEMGESTNVTYRVHTEVDHVMVPNAVVRSGMLSGVKNAVVNLAKKVLKKKENR
jgi:hypothetical protein